MRVFTAGIFRRTRRECRKTRVSAINLIRRPCRALRVSRAARGVGVLNIAGLKQRANFSSFSSNRFSISRRGIRYVTSVSFCHRYSGITRHTIVDAIEASAVRRIGIIYYAARSVGWPPPGSPSDGFNRKTSTFRLEPRATSTRPTATSPRVPPLGSSHTRGNRRISSPRRDVLPPCRVARGQHAFRDVLLLPALLVSYGLHVGSRRAYQELPVCVSISLLSPCPFHAYILFLSSSLLLSPQLVTRLIALSVRASDARATRSCRRPLSRRRLHQTRGTTSENRGLAFNGHLGASLLVR